MKVILDDRSQNGRWGLQIVGPEDTEFPARGTLKHLGRRAGVECYEVSPSDEGDFWVVVGGDLEAISGCTEVCSMDLQGGSSVTLLSCRVGAVWQEFGYKRRNSEFRLLKTDGSTETPPVSVLLAAGTAMQSPSRLLAIASLTAFPAILRKDSAVRPFAGPRPKKRTRRTPHRGGSWSTIRSPAFPENSSYRAARRTREATGPRR